MLNIIKQLTEIEANEKTKVEKAFEQYAKLQAQVKVYEAKIKEIKNTKAYKDSKAEIVACCKCSKGKLSHMGLTATWVHKDEFITRAQEYVQITGMPAVELPKEIDPKYKAAMELLLMILTDEKEEANV